MPERTEPATIPQGAAGQFFLELVGLIGFGRLGWTLGDGGVRGALLASVIVVAAGALWTTFRTPGYVPSGRDPVVPIPGPVRLALELGFFTIGSVGLWVSGWELAGASLFLSTLALYAFVMHDRTLGLFRNAPPS